MRKRAALQERIFSFRSSSSPLGDPKNQRPEIWNIYNRRKKPRRISFGFSLHQIGPSLIYGSTSIARTFQLFHCICMQPSAQLSAENGMLIMSRMTTECSSHHAEAIEATHGLVFELWVVAPLTGAVESTANDLSQQCWNCCKVEPASARAAP